MAVRKLTTKPLLEWPPHQLVTQLHLQTSQVNTSSLMLLSAVSVPVLAVAGLLGLRGSGQWRVVAVTALAV